MKSSLLTLSLLLTFSLNHALALDNGLAKTPPMGWNSWNKFGCNVSESLIREMADAAVTSGMKDAGYQYIVIDDCWQVERDDSGNIMADSRRFPSGIKALADYIHSKGLKFGIYSDAGTGTCQNRPGGRGYEFQDARQYAAWGVDYLKYDWCNHSTQNSKASYSIMRDALAKTGRPITFSLCECICCFSVADFRAFRFLFCLMLPFKATAADPAIVGSAARFAPGFKWQEHSIVSGEFDCSGRRQQAIPGVSQTEIAVLVFLHGIRNRPEILRFSASVRNPDSAELTVEDLGLHERWTSGFRTHLLEPQVDPF